MALNAILPFKGCLSHYILSLSYYCHLSSYCLFSSHFLLLANFSALILTGEWAKL